MSVKLKKVIRDIIVLSHEDDAFIKLFFKYVFYKIFYDKNLVVCTNTIVKGVKNINCKGRLKIGIGFTGFSYKKDITFLNIRGELNIKKDYTIGRGCRFDIGENATVCIGKGGYVNVNSIFIIMNGLSIGNNCIISWNCQFLDEDFHTIEYENKKCSNSEIKIGNNVWIGNGVKIYKGTVIPDGCVVASNAVVRGVFKNKNSLIAGMPAKTIKNNIMWK